MLHAVTCLPGHFRHTYRWLHGKNLSAMCKKTKEKTNQPTNKAVTCWNVTCYTPMLQTLPSSGLLWMVQNNGLVQCLPVWLLIYWFLFGLNWQHALITHARTDYAYSQHVKHAWSRRTSEEAWESYIWACERENDLRGVRLGRPEVSYSSVVKAGACSIRSVCSAG